MEQQDERGGGTEAVHEVDNQKALVSDKLSDQHLVVKELVGPENSTWWITQTQLKDHKRLPLRVGEKTTPESLRRPNED